MGCVPYTARGPSCGFMLGVLLEQIRQRSSIPEGRIRQQHLQEECTSC